MWLLNNELVKSVDLCLYPARLPATPSYMISVGVRGIIILFEQAMVVLCKLGGSRRIYCIKMADMQSMISSFQLCSDKMVAEIISRFNHPWMYIFFENETVVHIFLFHFLRLLCMKSFFFDVLSALLLRQNC